MISTEKFTRYLVVHNVLILEHIQNLILDAKKSLENIDYIYPEQRSNYDSAMISLDNALYSIDNDL